MVLKDSFELFFLKCIFEFMINTAPQGSNSVNGREKYYKIINFIAIRCGGSWRKFWAAGSDPAMATSSFFFSFIVFLPFGFLLFILTADPLSFARFLRKRISSKWGFFRDHICVDTHLPRYEAIAYILPHFHALTHTVIHVPSAFIFAVCLRKAYISICVCQGFVESSTAFNNLSKILLWMKPSYFQHGSSLSLENVCDSWCMHQWNRVV